MVKKKKKKKKNTVFIIVIFHNRAHRFLSIFLFSNSIVKFSLTKKQKLTDEEELSERASQLVAHGRMLVDNYPRYVKD